uniref:F-box domain-containing protein n=1 Tax=Cuerna arida TaxID=1464854 RepID=A0A1B6FYN3_9HEMI
MEWLPLEVVELVAEYLTSKDLAACCAVSVSWRHIFNQDRVWKPHCNKGIADYLETAVCQVQPGFVSPVMKNNTLSPVCHWWMCFMRQNHLLNNWRENRCIIHKVELETEDLLSPFEFIYTFISHGYVIGFTSMRVMLWDVRNTPVYLRDPFCLPRNYKVCWCGMVSENMFFVVQKQCLQVYHFNTIFDDKWDLIHMFLLDGDETLSPSEVGNRRRYMLRHMLVIGNIFVGCNTRDEAVLHVWNVEEGKKLRRIECTMVSDSHTRIHRLVKSGKLSLDFVIILETKLIKTYRYSLKVYSLKELDFFKFSVSHDMPFYLSEDTFNCVLQDRFVAFTINGFNYVYNYLTSQLVVTSTPAHSLSVDCSCDVLAVGNRILFSENLKFNMVFNTNTLLITPLIVSNARNVPEEHDFTKSLTGNFFITQTGSKCNLWEMGRHSRLDSVTWLSSLKFCFTILSMCEINKSCTKVVLADIVENCFLVVSFW